MSHLFPDLTFDWDDNHFCVARIKDEMVGMIGEENRGWRITVSLLGGRFSEGDTCLHHNTTRAEMEAKMQEEVHEWLTWMYEQVQRSLHDQSQASQAQTTASESS